MAEQYVKKIDQYLIKDEEARTQLQTTIETVNTASSNASEAKSTASSAQTKANQNATLISGLTSRIDALEQNEHLKITYDASTETITFS